MAPGASGRRQRRSYSPAPRQAERQEAAAVVFRISARQAAAAGVVMFWLKAPAISSRRRPGSPACSTCHACSSTTPRRPSLRCAMPEGDGAAPFGITHIGAGAHRDLRFRHARLVVGQCPWLLPPNWLHVRLAYLAPGPAYHGLLVHDALVRRGSLVSRSRWLRGSSRGCSALLSSPASSLVVGFRLRAARVIVAATGNGAGGHALWQDDSQQNASCARRSCARRSRLDTLLPRSRLASEG